MEGATAWQIFLRIALPLSVDGIIVTAINVFAFGWNEALFASAFTSRTRRRWPRSSWPHAGRGDIDFNLAAVNTLIAILPPVDFVVLLPALSWRAACRSAP